MADRKASRAGELASRFRVSPGSRVDLRRVDPDGSPGFSRESAGLKMTTDLARLASLQERIWAERKHRVLIVLQGIDASGKDGTISHVMSAFNPQGCRVVGFGVPSEVELAHDYLWRIHAATPRTGEIVIFNRSHYESVLVERVHSLVPEAVWRKRYDQINDFEATLAAEGTTIVKFFLHIDRDEQLARLKARYDDPTKRWKFNVGDLAERARWDDYAQAYQDALANCHTDEAPWYVIPADRKWYRNWAIRQLLLETLRELDPQYPAREDLDVPALKKQLAAS
jgi:PPK2 family polyphosphate:nucleotide phosphotransferase